MTKPRCHNLADHLTSFVGREREVAEVGGSAIVSSADDRTRDRNGNP
jgi:hypothetical protein